MTQLRLLYLNKTDVTDAGLTHLEHLTNLTWLGLRFTYVSDEGIKKMRRALPGCDMTNNHSRAKAKKAGARE